MPRKKKAIEEAARAESNATATAVAEPEPMTRPAYIDGPPTDASGQIEPQAKNWGGPTAGDR